MNDSVTFPSQTAAGARIGWPAMLFMIYSYFQVLDLMTTAAFMANGVMEANPVIRYLMSMGSAPLTGLIAIKLLAFMLGVYCWRFHRVSLLAKANVFFGLLIVWNLLALILRSAMR